MGPRWWRRCRRGEMGRPPKPVAVGCLPPCRRLDPFPCRRAEPLILEVAEVEALRLVELEKLSLEEAGRRMGVSRNTVWRLVEGAREKVAKALVEGRGIRISEEVRIKLHTP